MEIDFLEMYSMWLKLCRLPVLINSFSQSSNSREDKSYILETCVVATLATFLLQILQNVFTACEQSDIYADLSSYNQIAFTIDFV